MNSNKDYKIKEDIICGRNSVLEALKSDRPCEYLLVSKSDMNGSINQIISLAKKKNILIKEVAVNKLDYMCGISSHQGVVFVVSQTKTYTVDEILDDIEKRNESPFIVICDKIKDPHNLGAIIRTAEATGVNGIIIPERRNVGLNVTVSKTACGALEYVHVAKVKNISDSIDYLKNQGIWVFGADMNGEDYNSVDFSGPIALVIGSEGEGISRLVKNKCDKIVSLPMKGNVNSLNASVAAGILMYKILSFR